MAAELKENMLLNTDTRLLGSTDKVNSKKRLSQMLLSAPKLTGQTFDPDLDGGWAWVVLVSAFVTNIISSGFIYNSGILYVAFLEEFQESRTFTSWIIVVQTLILCISGPIASMLLSLIGARFSAMLGGGILSITVGLTYFANSVWFLIIDLGFSGFGASLVIVSNVACVARYFKVKIYMATAINISAVGFGIMIFGVELEWAIETFGWRYSMIIQSAFLLQILVCAALVFDQPSATNLRRKSASKITSAAPPIAKKRELDQKSNEEEREQLSAPTPSLSSPPHEGVVDIQNNTLPLSPTANGSNATKDGDNSNPAPITIRDSLRYFGDVRFCLILISLFLFYGSSMIVFSVIKDVTMQNGATNYDIVVASMGICNAIGRIVCGLQVVFINPPLMYFFSSSISAIATAGLILANTETLSILCASLIGFFQGQQTCLQSLSLAYLFSRNMMAILFGYGLAAGGLSAVVFGPISGYLVDSSGSYVNSLTLTSVCLFCSGVFVLISYQIHRKKIGVKKVADKSDALIAINSYVKVIDA